MDNKFILGTKYGMTQTWDDQGNAVPVTLIRVTPNTVTQVKTKDTDGYEAVQVGTGAKRGTSKALAGHLKGAGPFRYLCEFEGLTQGDKTLAVGDILPVTIFVPGDKVKVSAINKGKGFQGAVKRHGFSGMPSSHGHSAVKRHIGSIGQRFPQHTLKGKKMAGHMGSQRTTVRGLKVITVDEAQGMLAVKGAVPGPRGVLVEIVAI